MARRANSLTTLVNQINQMSPNRNRASDGWLGDAAHQATVSQHNPNKAGVVTAQDITHDPANGVDGQAIADAVIQDPRVWYVIFNKRIRYNGGQWQPYSGTNPHTKHIHLSVKQNASSYDNGDNWSLKGVDMAEKVNLDSAKILTNGILRRDTQVVHSGGTDADLLSGHVGQDLTNNYIMSLWLSPEAQAGVAYEAQLKTFYNKYSKLVGELESRPTKAQLEEVATKLQAESAKVAKAEEALKAEQAKKSEDTVLLDEAGSWFTKLVNRLFKKG